jgi:hypothetical protein
VAHVLATWSAADRRSDVLVAVDVSGSMHARAAGTDAALIDLVKQGITTLGSLLPDNSRLTLWEFGTELDPPRDYRTLLPGTELDRAGRATLGQAVGSLQARETGTGLYDTILAAYRAGQDGYRPDAPTHVVVFTDGRNQSDPGSISPEQRAHSSPGRPTPSGRSR